MLYKTYEIEKVTEEHLKPYGNIMFHKEGKPAEFAKDIDDAKRKIDDIEWEDEKRYSD